MNYFKKFDKVLIDVWKSYDRSSFLEYEKKFKGKVISATLSNTKQIKELEKKHNINVSDLISISQNKNNAVEMVEKKAEIIKQIETNVKGEDKKRLINLVNTETHTKYGTFQENSAIKLFENTTSKKVTEQQKRFCYHLNSLDNVDWFLIGKIDGVINDGAIFEVKNRVNKLFNQVRGYELPQVMTYMKLAGTDKAYLLEQYKNKAKSDFNINKIDYKKKYFELNVLPAIHSFQKFFSDFIKNDEWKEKLILGQEAELYELYLTY